MTSGSDGDPLASSSSSSSLSASASAKSALVALGTELRRLRQRRGLSQRELTRLIGLSAHSNLADYEAGRRMPPADIVAECERVLEVTDGRLVELRSQALIARADEPGAEAEDLPGSGAKEPAGEPVGAPAGPDGDPSPPTPTGLGRFRSGRMRVAGVSVAGLVLIGIVAALVAATGNSGHAPAPVKTQKAVTHSPNGTRLADGVDPKRAACDLDAVNLASAPLNLPATAIVDHHRITAGTTVGYIRLRYSPRCHVAWARLDPLSLVTKPGAGSVYINAIRPSNGADTPFRSNLVQQVYGNILLTDSGCIKAIGTITLGKGPAATATTRCASPAR